MGLRAYRRAGDPGVCAVLTLSYVQTSAHYNALRSAQKAAVNAAINALTSILAPVGPGLSPARNAARDPHL